MIIETRFSSERLYSHQTVERLRQGKFGFNVWVAIYNKQIIAYHIYDNNLNGPLYRKFTVFR